MDTVLDIKAVEAMLKDIKMQRLLQTVAENAGFNWLWIAGTENRPDWIVSAMNCNNYDNVLPVAMHTFLLDWKSQ